MDKNKTKTDFNFAAAAQDEVSRLQELLFERFHVAGSLAEQAQKLEGRADRGLLVKLAWIARTAEEANKGGQVPEATHAAFFNTADKAEAMLLRGQGAPQEASPARLTRYVDVGGKMIRWGLLSLTAEVALLVLFFAVMLATVGAESPLWVTLDPLAYGFLAAMALSAAVALAGLGLRLLRPLPAAGRLTRRFLRGYAGEWARSPVGTFILTVVSIGWLALIWSAWGHPTVIAWLFGLPVGLGLLLRFSGASTDNALLDELEERAHGAAGAGRYYWTAED